MGALNAQIKDAETEMARHDDELVEMRGRNERRGRIEARREAVVAETARRRAALDNELTDATEDLRRLLAEFNDTIDETRAKEQEEERAVSDLALTAKAYKDKREVAMKHHGKLAAEAEAHAKRVADRASFLRGVVARRPELGPLPACFTPSTRDSPRRRARCRRRDHARCGRDARAYSRGWTRSMPASCARQRGWPSARARMRKPRARRREESVRLRAETRDATRERGSAGGRDRLERGLRAHVADLERRADRRSDSRRRAAGAGGRCFRAGKAEALASLDAPRKRKQDLAAVAGETPGVRLKREELFAKEEACSPCWVARGRTPTSSAANTRRRDGRGARRRRRARGGGGGGAAGRGAAAVAADGAAAATRAAQGALARANGGGGGRRARGARTRWRRRRAARRPARPRRAATARRPPRAAPFAGYDARLGHRGAAQDGEADLTV